MGWWIAAFALALLVAALLVFERRHAPPYLVVVDRPEELEGLVRLLSGRGAPVLILPVGPSEEAWAIARRLERTLPDVMLVEDGDVAEGLRQCPAPVATVVQLAGAWGLDEIRRFV
jgi:CheY-like chemotaxis protein